MASRTKNVVFPEPQMIESSTKLNNSVEIKSSRSDSSDGSSVRRNRASTLARTDKYNNIEGGIIPFTYGGGSRKYGSNISVRDAIILCQKAYYNFSIFRNTVDLMTEFSCSPIYFTGGNEQSNKFFKAWSDRINLWKLQDMFFREFFRSGNVFLYKLNAEFTKQDMRVLTDLITTEAKTGDVPIRYIILNPADIEAIGSTSLITPKYIKILNDFEMQVLMNPTTEHDKELSKKIKKSDGLLNKSGYTQPNQYMIFELEQDRFIPVFYKKQDYEPFSVPMGFPVLEDINWKAELKNMDMAISRTIQQAVLLVTMGNDEVGMPTKEQIQNLRKIFENESVGRILVTDYTTDIEFKIPAIGDILDPKKYEVVDRDIRYGLNNVLFGEEKFANTSTKIEVFLSRLKHARETFMNEFLIPEIKKIGKDLGFKNLPTPRFKDSDFKSDINLTRIYSRLLELGVLTPEEGITAIETGRLPLPEESINSQKAFIKLQDDGLYQPLLNKNMQQQGASGRPAGSSGINKTVNTPKNIAKSSREESPVIIDANLIAKNLVLFDNLVNKIEGTLKTKFNKKKLTLDQKNIVQVVAETIATNESPEHWLNKIDFYISQPLISNDKMSEIYEISEEKGVDYKTAVIMYHSKKQIQK
jgi:hypothetical protein